MTSVIQTYYVYGQTITFICIIMIIVIVVIVIIIINITLKSLELIEHGVNSRKFVYYSPHCYPPLGGGICTHVI